MRRRPAFTLVELLVVMAIATLVCTTAIRALSRQQRFYSAATSMLDMRGQLRDGADALIADVRGAAVARYGFPTMADSAVELYASIGTSAICAVSGNSIFLVPSRLASGADVSSFVATPDTGDIALIYIHSSVDIDSSAWVSTRIAAVTSRAVSTTCPPSSGFTSSADAAAGRTTYSVTFAGGIPAGARRGSPLRFLRRGRYSLYRSGDGSWQLGYRRCGASAPHTCSTIQPVSGPYRAFDPDGESGLTFRYYDSSGSELFDAALSPRVARVDVVLRAQTPRALSLTGDAVTRNGDSVLVTISPRNRGNL
jgi:prepilin-type N-terminal cleavage/methylation domain-containing protein